MESNNYFESLKTEQFYKKGKFDKRVRNIRTLQTLRAKLADFQHQHDRSYKGREF